MPLIDQFGRTIHDLRISITDRCNYRCVYCRTGTYGAQYPELTLAEYLRMARVFVSLGITKIRLTGGEPLLRKDVIELVRQLHASAHRGGQATRAGHHHQRASAGGDGRAAEAGRARSRDREHGRRGPGALCPHHAHAQRI